MIYFFINKSFHFGKFYFYGGRFMFYYFFIKKYGSSLFDISYIFFYKENNYYFGFFNYFNYFLYNNIYNINNNTINLFGNLNYGIKKLKKKKKLFIYSDFFYKFFYKFYFFLSFFNKDYLGVFRWFSYTPISLFYFNEEKFINFFINSGSFFFFFKNYYGLISFIIKFKNLNLRSIYFNGYFFYFKGINLENYFILNYKKLDKFVKGINFKLLDKLNFFSINGKLFLKKNYFFFYLRFNFLDFFKLNWFFFKFFLLFKFFFFKNFFIFFIFFFKNFFMKINNTFFSSYGNFFFKFFLLNGNFFFFNINNYFFDFFIFFKGFCFFNIFLIYNFIFFRGLISIFFLFYINSSLLKNSVLFELDGVGVFYYKFNFFLFNFFSFFLKCILFFLYIFNKELFFFGKIFKFNFNFFFKNYYLDYFLFNLNLNLNNTILKLDLLGIRGFFKLEGLFFLDSINIFFPENEKLLYPFLINDSKFLFLRNLSYKGKVKSGAFLKKRLFSINIINNLSFFLLLLFKGKRLNSFPEIFWNGGYNFNVYISNFLIRGSFTSYLTIQSLKNFKSDVFSFNVSPGYGFSLNFIYNGNYIKTGYRFFIKSNNDKLNRKKLISVGNYFSKNFLKRRKVKLLIGLDGNLRVNLWGKLSLQKINSGINLLGFDLFDRSEFSYFMSKNLDFKKSHLYFSSFFYKSVLGSKFSFYGKGLNPYGRWSSWRNFGYRFGLILDINMLKFGGKLSFLFLKVINITNLISLMLKFTYRGGFFFSFSFLFFKNFFINSCFFFFNLKNKFKNNKQKKKMYGLFFSDIVEDSLTRIAVGNLSIPVIWRNGCGYSFIYDKDGFDLFGDIYWYCLRLFRIGYYGLRSFKGKGRIYRFRSLFGKKGLGLYSQGKVDHLYLPPKYVVSKLRYISKIQRTGVFFNNSFNNLYFNGSFLDDSLFFWMYSFNNGFLNLGNSSFFYFGFPGVVGFYYLGRMAINIKSFKSFNDLKKNINKNRKLRIKKLEKIFNKNNLNKGFLYNKLLFGTDLLGGKSFIIRFLINYKNLPNIIKINLKKTELQGYYYQVGKYYNWRKAGKVLGVEGWFGFLIKKKPIKKRFNNEVFDLFKGHRGMKLGGESWFDWGRVLLPDFNFHTKSLYFSFSKGDLYYGPSYWKLNGKINMGMGWNFLRANTYKRIISGGRKLLFNYTGLYSPFFPSGVFGHYNFFGYISKKVYRFRRRGFLFSGISGELDMKKRESLKMYESRSFLSFYWIENYDILFKILSIGYSKGYGFFFNIGGYRIKVSSFIKSSPSFELFIGGRFFTSFSVRKRGKGLVLFYGELSQILFLSLSYQSNSLKILTNFISGWIFFNLETWRWVFGFFLIGLFYITSKLFPWLGGILLGIKGKPGRGKQKKRVLSNYFFGTSLQLIYVRRGVGFQQFYGVNKIGTFGLSLLIVYGLNIGLFEIFSTCFLFFSGFSTNISINYINFFIFYYLIFFFKFFFYIYK